MNTPQTEIVENLIKSHQKDSLDSQDTILKGQKRINTNEQSQDLNIICEQIMKESDKNNQMIKQTSEKSLPKEKDLILQQIKQLQVINEDKKQQSDQNNFQQSITQEKVFNTNNALVNQSLIITSQDIDKLKTEKEEYECSINIDYYQYQNQEIIDYFNQNESLKKSYLLIFKKLAEKSYYLSRFLAKGGQGFIFEGFQLKGSQEKEELAFKVMVEEDKKEIEEEIAILKLFKKNINFINIFDVIKISDEIWVYVLVKAKHSLKKELIEIFNKKTFSVSQFFKMILDLIDGLIQLKVYNILHLDIKPDNILITKYGNYVYTDFGLSQKYRQGDEVTFKGCTPNFASLEQFNQDTLLIDFSSDLYSLGKTFIEILKVFELVNPNNDILNYFHHEIIPQMTDKTAKNRIKCDQLHKKIFWKFLTQEKKGKDHYHIIYFLQISEIFEQSLFDINRNIPYFKDIQLYYKKLTFEIWVKFVLLVEPYQFEDDFEKFLCNQVEWFKIRKQDFKKSDYFSISSRLEEIGKTYSDIGDFKNSYNYLFESLQLRKEYFGEDNLLIADSHTQIGECLKNMGKFKEALVHQLKSIEMRKSLLSAEGYQNMINCLYNIGMLYIDLSEFQIAYNYFVETLQMEEMSQTRDDQRIAIILSSIGIIFFHFGNYQEAIRYQQNSLRIQCKINKNTNHNIAADVMNLGLYYLFYGDFQKALHLVNRSHNMFKELYAENHIIIGDSLQNLGTIFMQTYEYEKALDCFKKSLNIYESQISEDCYGIARSLNGIGSITSYFGHFNEALSYYEKALKICQKIYSGDYFVASILLNKGLCYSELGNSEKTLDCYMQSLKISKQLFIDNHPLTANIFLNIGIHYLSQNDFEKAQNYMEKSLYINRALFKRDHPDILECLLYLAKLNIERKQLDSALILLEDSLEMAQKLRKTNHSLTAQSLMYFGQYYRQKGDINYALKYLKQSLLIQESIYKESHPQILLTLEYLLFTFQQSGDFRGSLGYAKKYHKMVTKLYHERKDKATTDCLQAVGEIFFQCGEIQNAFLCQLQYLEMDKKLNQGINLKIIFSLFYLSACYHKIGDPLLAMLYQQEYQEIIFGLKEYSFLFNEIAQKIIIMSGGSEKTFYI